MECFVLRKQSLLRSAQSKIRRTWTDLFDCADSTISDKNLTGVHRIFTQKCRMTTSLAVIDRRIRKRKKRMYKRMRFPIVCAFVSSVFKIFLTRRAIVLPLPLPVTTDPRPREHQQKKRNRRLCASATTISISRFSKSRATYARSCTASSTVRVGRAHVGIGTHAQNQGDTHPCCQRRHPTAGTATPSEWLRT